MVRDWALREVGYVPVSGKYNKYAEMLDKTNIYNGRKNGYDWCDVFADCDYVSNFGLDVAVRMIAQPLRGCGAGCAFSASYYRAADQWDRDPSVEAQIVSDAFACPRRCWTVSMSTPLPRSWVAWVCLSSRITRSGKPIWSRNPFWLGHPHQAEMRLGSSLSPCHICPAIHIEVRA